jgi:hypothetical protein
MPVSGEIGSWSRITARFASLCPDEDNFGDALLLAALARQIQGVVTAPIKIVRWNWLNTVQNAHVPVRLTSFILSTLPSNLLLLGTVAGSKMTSIDLRI